MLMYLIHPLKADALQKFGFELRNLVSVPTMKKN